MPALDYGIPTGNPYQGEKIRKLDSIRGIACVYLHAYVCVHMRTCMGPSLWLLLLSGTLGK